MILTSQKRASISKRGRTGASQSPGSRLIGPTKKPSGGKSAGTTPRHRAEPRSRSSRSQRVIHRLSRAVILNQPSGLFDKQRHLSMIGSAYHCRKVQPSNFKCLFHQRRNGRGQFPSWIAAGRDVATS